LHKTRITLSKKMFAISVLLSSTIILVAYILVYLLIPRFYRDFIITRNSIIMETHLLKLQQAQNLGEEIDILHSLWAENAQSITLTDKEGLILHQTFFARPGLVVMNDSPIEAIREERASDAERVVETKNTLTIADNSVLKLNFVYTNNNSERKLGVNIPMQPLTDARQVLVNIYPVATLTSIIFSSLLVFLFTLWVIRPIERIQKSTAKMAKIEPNILLPKLANDEIGDLGKDIYLLYHQLTGTILRLEEEIQKGSSSENKKIEFLQTVSHEMKTPLTSANGILEAILYEVPPFDRNTKKHLEECKLYLDQTIALTKENLRLSEEYKEEATNFSLVLLFGEITSSYNMILKSKQISYTEILPMELDVFTKKQIFKKILSNIFSNATNHTRQGGKIEVKYEDGILSVFNTCYPIPTEEIQALFSPLIIRGTYEHSTGLGLFIIKKLLEQLEIAYQFNPSKNNDGMIFTLDLRKIQKTSDI